MEFATSSSPVKISSFSPTPRATSLSYKALVAWEKSSLNTAAKREVLEVGSTLGLGCHLLRYGGLSVAFFMGTYPSLSIFSRSVVCVKVSDVILLESEVPPLMQG